MRLKVLLIGAAAAALGAAGYFGWQAYSGSSGDIAEAKSRPSAAFLWALNSNAGPEPFRPIPANVALDEGKVRLGGRLFHDPRLSGDGTLSCASCHQLELGGADGQPTPSGIGGAAIPLNSPTVLNSGFNLAQFWDGRAASLEEQAAGPLLSPVEMGSNWPHAIKVVTTDRSYGAAFAELYGGVIEPATILDAIATFERSLTTPGAPFDRYLKGETGAISERAKAGLELFTSFGCSACHQGVNMGGNLFQKLGVVVPYFKDAEAVTQANLGRFNVTGLEEDRHVFKVPSLRNIALTGPYFHDGSVQRLEEAVALMAFHQLGRSISGEEVELITEFLQTLTGAPDGGQ